MFSSIWNPTALDQFYVYTLRISPSGLHLSPQTWILSPSLTAVGLYAMLAAGLILIPWLGGNQVNSVCAQSGILQVTEAALYDSVITFVSPNIKSWTVLLNVIVSFILVANLLGNIPFGYTLTTSVSLVMGANIALWLWLVGVKVYLQEAGFLGSFLPSGTPLALTPILAPIEIISYTARGVSLGVRLFSNILAGHTLLAILSGFIISGLSSSPLIQIVSIAACLLFSLLGLLELAVSGIQSYVFGVLLASYMSESL